jgi:hypothetical protein
VTTYSGPTDMLATAISNQKPSLLTLLPQVGPLDAKAKARKVTVRREKQALAELTRPDEVQVLPLYLTACIA